MALNFLTGSRSSTTEEAPEATEPETNTTDEEEPAAPARRRRRGTRGGRSSAASKAAKAASESADEKPAAPRRAPARRRTSDDEEPAAAARPTRRRAATAKAKEDEEAAEKPRRAAAPRRRPRAAAAAPVAPEENNESELLTELQEQNEQLTRLLEQQEQTIERLTGSGGGSRSGGRGRGRSAGKALPRVGVFVDSANVELARDRTRGGRPIDWGVVLERLTEGRQLVRAIAYSPVHDDPDVSPETQRFVEPFLGKGFKIVTKPLKRFADGSIKANVDIELALDVITVADRLDIAVIISGDGDFQHLVEVLQGRGVRVEVAGLGPSVAGSLRKAADQYIELDFAQKKK